MQEYITGIQQIGIGVKDAQEAMHWYKALFGMDVLIFDDVAEAALMTQYTGHEKHKRRAVLTLNMAGGGGFELWQYLDRQPKAAIPATQYGDLGIYAAKMKCIDVPAAYEYFSTVTKTSELQQDHAGNLSFWVTDDYGNPFHMVGGQDWFDKKDKRTGGVAGAVIGVSDMAAAIKFYSGALGISDVIYDVADEFESITDSQPRLYHKVLLRKPAAVKGAFGKLLGGIEIELVQAMDRAPTKIYKDRYWGDLGFIHVCMDVLDMDGLKKHAADNGFTFTVDSNESFSMEAAAGRFCYVEDPDGTLIELVETHKVPVMKKYGLYLNLKRRGLQKPLPNWMIKMLSISKVK